MADSEGRHGIHLPSGKKGGLDIFLPTFADYALFAPYSNTSGAEPPYRFLVYSRTNIARVTASNNFTTKIGITQSSQLALLHWHDSLRLGPTRPRPR